MVLMPGQGTQRNNRFSAEQMPIGSHFDHYLRVTRNAAKKEQQDRRASFATEG
jgi:hypothetical protein